MSLVIHHLGLSQSERIVWLCEELELPYKLVRHERDPVIRNAPESYRALHPAGTSPAIVDGRTVLGETGAIFEYLLTRYGARRLTLAPDHPDYAVYLYWLHYSNGSLMPALMMQMAVNVLAPGEDSEATRVLTERTRRGFAMVEARLAGASYFAGDVFTAADVMMGFPLTTMRYFVPVDIASFPALLRYLERVAQRPAYRRAMATAEPDLEPFVR